jgi:peptide/nickel transport system substrate-binding protein
MQEHELRHMIGQVKAGILSRRQFVQAMIALGLTAPMAGQMLTSAGVAQAQS